MLDQGGSCAEDFGGVGWLDTIPLAPSRSRIEVLADGLFPVSISCRGVSHVSDRNSVESFCRTEERVRRCSVANGFASDRVLLVIEFQGCRGDMLGHQVIQRYTRGVVDFPIEDEDDVFESEGLGAGLGILGVEVFAGPEEPEETDDEKVDSVVVHFAEAAVTAGVDHFPEDPDVDGVGALLRVVVSSHAFEESIE